MDREAEVRRATMAMDKALADIRASDAGKMTAGQEARYGDAYQRLVRLGDKPQLRRKHRGQH